MSHSTVELGNNEDWIILGENVGIAIDSENALDMLIDSHTHYSNLIDPRFTHMSIGVVVANNKYFFMQEFMQLEPQVPTQSVTTTTKPVKICK